MSDDNTWALLRTSGADEVGDAEAKVGPPAPSGFKKLTPPLRPFVEVFHNYDEAVELPVKVHDLAIFQGTQEVYEARLQKS